MTDENGKALELRRVPAPSRGGHAALGDWSLESGAAGGWPCPDRDQGGQPPQRAPGSWAAPGLGTPVVFWDPSVPAEVNEKLTVNTRAFTFAQAAEQSILLLEKKQHS